MNRLTRSTSVLIPSPTVFAPTIESDSQVSKHRAVVAVCRAFTDRHPEQDTVKTHPIYPGAYDGIAYTRDKYHRMEHTPAGGGRYHVRTGQILPQLTVVQVPDGRSTGRSCRNSPTFADPSSELDPRPTCDHPGASTPPGVCLSSKPPSDPEQTHAAAASSMLARPPRPESVYHPSPHPILNKHTWPVQVGCLLPAPVLCPFRPALTRGHRTRYVTKHPGTDDMTRFHSTPPPCSGEAPATPWTQTDPTPQRSAEQTTQHLHSSRSGSAQPHHT